MRCENEMNIVLFEADAEESKSETEMPWFIWLFLYKLHMS